MTDESPFLCSTPLRSISSEKRATDKTVSVPARLWGVFFFSPRQFPAWLVLDGSLFCCVLGVVMGEGREGYGLWHRLLQSLRFAQIVDYVAKANGRIFPTTVVQTELESITYFGTLVELFLSPQKKTGQISTFWAWLFVGHVGHVGHIVYADLSYGMWDDGLKTWSRTQHQNQQT